MSDTFPRSEVLNMKDQVEYTKGSIVSKQVLKMPAGNLTLFAFDAGQELNEHTAPFDALIQILEGVAEIYIAGEKHLLEKGESIIMPANIPHAIRAIEKFKMLLTMIRAV